MREVETQNTITSTISDLSELRILYERLERTIMPFKKACSALTTAAFIYISGIYLVLYACIYFGIDIVVRPWPPRAPAQHAIYSLVPESKNWIGFDFQHNQPCSLSSTVPFQMTLIALNLDPVQ